jgi:hypothetical protein
MSRAERRRQQRDDRKRIARGLDVAARDGADVAALMRVLHDQAQQAIAERSVDPLMAFFCESLALTERRIAGVEIACRKGCSHCCNIWVSATAPEAIYVVKSIRAADKPPCTRESAAAAHALTEGKSYRERAGMFLPCPMLEMNVCSVYPWRPLMCRGAASVDAALCERAYTRHSGEQIPQPLPYAVMSTGYAVALSGALRHAGLAATPGEYNAALMLAFDRSEAEGAWLDGADILAGLPRSPGSDVFEAPWNRKLYEEAFG